MSITHCRSPSASFTRSPKSLPPPPPRKQSSTKLTKSRVPKQRNISWIMDNLQMSITSDVDLDHSDMDMDADLNPISPLVSPQKPKKRPSHKKTQSLSMTNLKITPNTPVTFENYYLRIDTRSAADKVSENAEDMSPTVPSLKKMNKHKAKLTKRRRRKSSRKLKNKRTCPHLSKSKSANVSDSESDSESKSDYRTKRRRRHSAQNVLARVRHKKYVYDSMPSPKKSKSKSHKSNGHRSNIKSAYKSMNRLKVIKDGSHKRTQSMGNVRKKPKKSKQRTKYTLKSVPKNVENNLYWTNMDYRLIRPKRRRKKAKSYNSNDSVHNSQKKHLSNIST